MGRLVRNCAVRLPLAAALIAFACFGADILSEARRLSREGRDDDAVRLLENHLRESPGDSDARVLCGLILSWNRHYDEARSQFEEVLAKHPGYGDALQGLINVEIWSGHLDRADRITAEALSGKRADTGVLMARVRALRALNRDREALGVVQEVLAIDPVNTAARDAERSLGEELSQVKVSVGHSYEWFHNSTGAWNQTDLSMTRATPIGSVSATFSRAASCGAVIPGEAAS